MAEWPLKVGRKKNSLIIPVSYTNLTLQEVEAEQWDLELEPGLRRGGMDAHVLAAASWWSARV